MSVPLGGRFSEEHSGKALQVILEGSKFVRQGCNVVIRIDSAVWCSGIANSGVVKRFLELVVTIVTPGIPHIMVPLRPRLDLIHELFFAHALGERNNLVRSGIECMPMNAVTRRVPGISVLS